MRRAARGPQYGDAMIGAVEELQLREEARRKSRIAQLQTKCVKGLECRVVSSLLLTVTTCFCNDRAWGSIQQRSGQSPEPSPKTKMGPSEVTSFHRQNTPTHSPAPLPVEEAGPSGGGGLKVKSLFKSMFKGKQAHPAP